MSLSCEAARERLLEAEREEMRGHGGGELAEHVRGCAPCAERARRILEGEAALRAAIGRMAAATSSSDDVSAPPPHRSPRSPAAARLRRSLRLAVPLAAAAAVAVVWAGGGEGPKPPPPPDVDAVYALDAPFVAAPEDRRTAVLSTGNPRITIVWFF